MSEDVVELREVSEMSARTMRVQPSWANAVAVALPMPVFVGILLVRRSWRAYRMTRR